MRNTSQIGFNNLNFDYPVLHWFINNYKNYELASDLAVALHYKGDEIIHQEFSAIRPKDVLIPQLDLFKIWHFDNKAKMTSLKALEIAMRLDNVQDLPFSPSDDINQKHFDLIIEYCINDVTATYEFYLRSKNEIKLRVDLSKEYSLDLINHNDPKMGEEIFLDSLSKEMNMNKWDLRKMRSPSTVLIFKDYILDYANFRTEKLQKFLDYLFKYKTTNTKNGFKYSAKLGDFTIDFGQGGLHGCIKSGIYESSDELIICDLDVASYYPNLAINNNFRPKHLGEAFSNIYKDMYVKRKSIPKSDSRNYGLKIALNGSFGKMNDEHSFLYDPESLLKITLNGQLLLAMLMENIHLDVPVKFLQGNTDGFTFMCNRNSMSKIKELVKNWELLTGLQMEYAYYSKMIIRDVNNYISVYDDGHYKLKGCFEIDRAWHKNHSMIIVSKSLKEYFLNNTPVKSTIDSCTDIYDFCKRARATGDSKLVLRHNNSDNYLQKNNRYYISKDGADLIKIMSKLEDELGNDRRDKLARYRRNNPNQLDMFHILDDVVIDANRESNVEFGYKCTIFNKFEEPDFHLKSIDTQYYIKECYKIINAVEGRK